MYFLYTCCTERFLSWAGMALCNLIFLHFADFAALESWAIPYHSHSGLGSHVSSLFNALGGRSSYTYVRKCGK